MLDLNFFTPLLPALFCYLFACLRRALSITQDGAGLFVLLTQLPKNWGYRYKSPNPDFRPPHIHVPSHTCVYILLPTGVYVIHTHTRKLLIPVSPPQGRLIEGKFPGGLAVNAP